MKAKTILFGNRKGGTGKTTCAILLAKSLVQGGHKVLLMDCDDQQSVQRHVDQAGGSCIFEHENFPQDINTKREQANFYGIIDDFRQEYDYIIFDQAGRLEDSYKFEALFTVADHVFVPVTPTVMAWNGTSQYLKFLMDMERHPQIHVFMNMFYRGRKSSRQMLKDLKGLEGQGLHVLRNPVSQYEAIGDMTVTQLGTGNEMADLNVWNWSREVVNSMKPTAV